MFEEIRQWVLQNFFSKRDFAQSSRGTQDANRPVALGSGGLLSPTMMQFKGSSVYHNANQSIANATWTALAMNSERRDTGYHSISVNNSRLTVPAGYGGPHLVAAGVEFLQNGTGYRAIALYKNGTTFVRMANSLAIATQDHWLALSAVLILSASDYIELRVYQDSGGALNVRVNSDYSPTFEIVYLGA